MRKLFTLIVLFTLISCEGIQYDGETRLVFQTVVLNSSGQPLPNSHVEISVGNAYSTGLISKGLTDKDGKITLLFPAPKNDLGINLRIYNDDDSYLQKEILNIRKADFENYKFIYQNDYLLKYDETAPLQLIYNQTSSNKVITKVSINGTYHMDQEFYNYSSDDYFPVGEILLKKNQAFQLKYTVLNLQSQAQTAYSVDLNIGNEPISYTINF